MNKKAAIVGLLVVLFVAAMNCTHADFTSIFTVGGDGSTTPKSTFDFDSETPWLYLELPDPGFNVSVSFWTSPGSDQFFVGSLSNASQYWFSIDDGVDSNKDSVTWNSVKQLGLWNIVASYLYPLGNLNNPASGVGTTSFNVVPEPVSTVLFLIGGATLAIRRLRRK